MTKYILHGGKTSEPYESNQNFFREIAAGLAEPIKVLIVQFAREEEKWPEQFEWEKGKFGFLKKRIEFTPADPDLEVFRAQVARADAVFLIGGDTQLLYEKLKNIENISELFRGKTIAGSSAGANVLAKYYYSNDYLRPEDGLGILPIKAFVHYSDAEFKDALGELKNYKENLEIKTIPEKEFIIMNI